MRTKNSADIIPIKTARRKTHQPPFFNQKKMHRLSHSPVITKRRHIHTLSYNDDPLRYSIDRNLFKHLAMSHYMQISRATDDKSHERASQCDPFARPHQTLFRPINLLLCPIRKRGTWDARARIWILRKQNGCPYRDSRARAD